MLNVKLIAVFIVAILLGAAGFVLLSGPGDEDNDDEADDTDENLYPSSVIITQNNGVQVEVATPVERICLVNGNAAEFMQVLNVTDKVVGVSESIIEDPEYGYLYEDVETIGSWRTPIGEKILELNCSVVIGQCTSMAIKEPAVLEALGITVILLDCYGLNQQTEDLRQLASLFGYEAMDKAEEYIEVFNDVVATVAKAGADFGPDVTAYVELSNGKAYTSKAEMSALIDLAGGYNIVKDLIENPPSSTQLLSNEVIIAYDDGEGPSFIFVRDSGIYDDATGEAEYQTLLGREGWSDLNATLNDNIYIICQSGILSGPRVYIGLVFLAEMLHPGVLDIFADDLVDDYNEMFGFDIGGMMSYHHVSS